MILQEEPTMKRALVTGANRGIGFAVAKGLTESGHEVLVSGRDPEQVEVAARKIGAQAVVLDVADSESIASTVKDIGHIDILINNAGVLGTGGVLDSLAEWDRAMRIMVDGPFQLMHYLVPNMVAQNYGRVVNVSSGWGAFSDGIAGPGAYGVAKAALNALTVSASRNIPDTVKINAMCPGWVRTRMGGKDADRSPEEGADTILWLATLDEDGPTGGFFRDRKPIAW